MLLVLHLLQFQFQFTVIVRLLVPPLASGNISNHTAGVLSVPCLPHQATALLRLKRSFTSSSYSVIAFRSWRAGMDCCHWMGVHCDYNNGLVTSLDG